MNDFKELLDTPLDPKNVDKHPYTGMDYIQAWHAINEANRIFGYNGWSCETVYNSEVSRQECKVNKGKDDGYKVGYEAKVKVTALGITREGTGHGSGQMKDLFDCIEGASKEAESDALKRALRTFGNQFGLALYDKKKRNVQAPDVVDDGMVKRANKAFNDISDSTELANKNDEIKTYLVNNNANELTLKAIEELYNKRSSELLDANA